MLESVDVRACFEYVSPFLPPSLARSHSLSVCVHVYVCFDSMARVKLWAHVCVLMALFHSFSRSHTGCMRVRVCVCMYIDCVCNSISHCIFPILTAAAAAIFYLFLSLALLRLLYFFTTTTSSCCSSSSSSSSLFITFIFTIVSSTHFICMHSHILQSHSNRAQRRTLPIAIAIVKS